MRPRQEAGFDRAIRVSSVRKRRDDPNSISSHPLAARLDATLKTFGFETLIDRIEIYEATRHARGVAYRTSVRAARSDIRSRSS
jgi:hypothetical protein